VRRLVVAPGLVVRPLVHPRPVELAPERPVLAPQVELALERLVPERLVVRVPVRRAEPRRRARVVVEAVALPCR
jgi:hypothetical protein